MTTARRARRLRPRLAETQILERRELTPDHWLMWIEKPEGFTFKPGQYCTIGSPRESSGRTPSRPRRSEERIELFIELVPYEEGGHLDAAAVTRSKTGDKLTITPAREGHLHIQSELQEPPAGRDGYGRRAVYQLHTGLLAARAESGHHFYRAGRRELSRRVRI